MLRPRVGVAACAPDLFLDRQRFFDCGCGLVEAVEREVAPPEIREPDRDAFVAVASFGAGFLEGLGEER